MVTEDQLDEAARKLAGRVNRIVAIDELTVGIERGERCKECGALRERHVERMVDGRRGYFPPTHMRLFKWMPWVRIRSRRQAKMCWDFWDL